MSFVTKDLDMVLFLNGRIRIKQNCRDVVRNYIERRKALYARKCGEEQETGQHKKLRHVIGADKGRNWCAAFHRPLKVKRDLIREASWKLPPNRYDVPLEIYECHRGAGGAHWPRIHKHKPLIEKPVERKARYNAQYKTKIISWLFPGNARDRRATTRCMVNSSTSCFRNPIEPGPTNYFPQHHTLQSNVCPRTRGAVPNPHIFLPHSSVPQKYTVMVKRHITMDPAPGRYEIRYPFFCPCHPKMLYMPGLTLFIEKQKRRRFRQLPYEKIKAGLYCDPEWRHVIGHGFRFRFRVEPRVAVDPQLQLKPPVKENENMRLQMFHDQRYLTMITKPTRTPISNPSCKVTDLGVRIKYNSLSKRVIRKQLRSNKKIAFQSGLERWKDGYKLPPLTASQQQANKETLPIERQLRDQPITMHPLTEVKGKLKEIPGHMLPSYMPELRKRLYKFLPLPAAKVLVTEQDTRPELVDGRYQCDNFYLKEVAPEKFFIPGIELKRAEEERLRAEMELKAMLEAEQLEAEEAAMNAEGNDSGEAEAQGAIESQ